MDVRLYQAAFRGNVYLLTRLLQEDSQLLDRALRDCSDKNNPLHIAARLGHSNFVREILTQQPQFAAELNSQGQAPLHLASAKGHLQVVKEFLEADPKACHLRDRDGTTPLHLASANGHLEVVKEFLKADPDACYLHDIDGKTPLHRAAMKGHVQVLEELVDANPETAWLLTDQGDPVLHLCVHHNQFEALKTLVKLVNKVEFVNLKDDGNNTILHLLAAKDQYEVIEILMTSYKGVHVNVVNVDGSTPLDVSRKNRSSRWKIKTILKGKGAKQARKIPPTRPKTRAQKMLNEKYQNWLSTIKEALMVVATVMASIAFQAALNPPGGVWQDDGYHNSTLYHDPNNPPKKIPHRAGEAIISYTLPSEYKAITLCTALGLLASLSLILLLVSGFSFQRSISIWILIIITWIAVASIMVTYLFSYLALTSNEIITSREFWMAVPGVLLMWLFIMGIVFSVQIYRFVRRLPHGSDFFQYIVKFPCRLCDQPQEASTHVGP